MKPYETTFAEREPLTPTVTREVSDQARREFVWEHSATLPEDPFFEISKYSETDLASFPSK